MSRAAFEVTDSKITCHRPLGLRVGLGFFGVLIGAMCLSLVYLLWPPPGSLADRSPADVLSQTMPFLLVPLLGLCGPTALFLYFAGPADLIVDTNKRTYRFRRGFPLLASWQSGPLEDIADLRVSTVNNKSATSYQLMLDWRNTQAGPWSLGNGIVSSRRPVQMMFSRDAGRVRDEARRLASRLGVPLQEAAPVWDQVRIRANIRLVLGPVILFFILAGLPPLLVGHALETQGQPATGTVVALHRGKGYSARYSYQVNGHVFTGRASLPWSTYSSLEVGGPLPVHYLPAYPHTSAVVGAQSGGSTALPLMLGGLALLLVLVFGRTPRNQ